MEALPGCAKNLLGGSGGKTVPGICDCWSAGREKRTRGLPRFGGVAVGVCKRLQAVDMDGVKFYNLDNLQAEKVTKKRLNYKRRSFNILHTFYRKCDFLT